jgi:hypothetical protein
MDKSGMVIYIRDGRNIVIEFWFFLFAVKNIDTNASYISCSLCGFTKLLSDESQKRPKWFNKFLYGVIVLNVILIINNLSWLIVSEHGVDLLTSEVNTLIIQIVLYAIEIFIYVLFLFYMKRKLLIGYMIFLIISALISAFTGGDLLFANIIGPLPVRHILIYFVFQSQWSKFKK